MSQIYPQETVMGQIITHTKILLQCNNDTSIVHLHIACLAIHMMRIEQRMTCTIYNEVNKLNMWVSNITHS